MILLVDIGNTRIKWAMLSAAGVGEQRAIQNKLADAKSIATELSRLGMGVERVLVANVGGPKLLNEFIAAVEAVWNLTPEVVHATASAGRLRNGYDNPEQLGVDRWLCLIGAYDIARGPVCVASIGTAMTVDLVDATGLHLGGVIVPGIDLATDSLLKNTSDLAKRSESGHVQEAFFANNTRGAIQQGIRHMLGATIERAVAEAEARLKFAPTTFLTGGGAELISKVVRSRHTVAPNLVFQGLAILALTEKGGD